MIYGPTRPIELNGSLDLFILVNNERIPANNHPQDSVDNFTTSEAKNLLVAVCMVVCKRLDGLCITTFADQPTRGLG